MSTLFLASSTSRVAADITKRIKDFHNGMKLVFVPTAAEVEEGDLWWLDYDRQALIDAGFDVTDFSITNKKLEEIRSALENAQAVFFSGGNTYFLLQEIQKSRCAAYIRERVHQGLLYMGSSAGSILAGPELALVKNLDDRGLAPDLKGTQALGLTDVIVFPHWGSPHFHKRYEKVMQNGYKLGHKIVLLTDDQYLYVTDDWYQIMEVTKS